MVYSHNELTHKSVLPVFEPVTQSVNTLSQSGCFHLFLLLLLSVVFLSSHRGELLNRDGCGDDDRVGTFSS